MNPPTNFEYSRWRHGGWYVHNVRYPSGAIGCVSNNYADKKWRIACDSRDPQPTFRTRDEAARAEWHLVQAEAKPDRTRNEYIENHAHPHYHTAGAWEGKPAQRFEGKQEDCPICAEASP